jgi:hypothetical protein
MMKLAVLVPVGATVALGLLLGLRYLRRVRNTPVLIGSHFLLGALSLEPMVVALRGGLGGVAAKPSLAGGLAAGLLTLALLSGVSAVMIGRRSRGTANVALGSHAAVAASAFICLVVWVFVP